VNAGTDTAYTYYYDKQSGQLTGIEFQASNITQTHFTCIAGQVSGVTLSGNPTPLRCGDAADAAAE